MLGPPAVPPAEHSPFAEDKVIESGKCAPYGATKGPGRPLAPKSEANAAPTYQSWSCSSSG
eukprot:8691620-Pyramimonas_sp.AAC.1